MIKTLFLSLCDLVSSFVDNPCRCISHKTVKRVFLRCSQMGYFLLNLTCSVCLYSEGHDHDVSSTDGNKNTEQTFFTQEKSVGSVYLAFSLTYNSLVRQSWLQHMKNKIWRSKFPLKWWSCPMGISKKKCLENVANRMISHNYFSYL